MLIIENFYFARFRIQFEAVDNLLLPEYKGSSFRGCFGHAFREVSCPMKASECSGCLLRGKCVYQYVFETSPPEGASIMSKYTDVPHPFVIEPPEEEKKEYQPGDRIFFNLLLIGKAVEYLPYFVYAFIKMGERGIGKNRGRIKLVDIACIDKSDSSRIVFSETGNTDLNPEIINEKFVMESAGLLIDNVRNNNHRLNLHFLTPVRLKYEGRFVNDLRFDIFIRNLARRVSLISLFHCGGQQGWNFREIIDKSGTVTKTIDETRWHDWERYSGRQNTRMNMGGLVGIVEFSGDLAEFLPLIKLGEYLHLGKNTSFGLGKYRICM